MKERPFEEQGQRPASLAAAVLFPERASISTTTATTKAERKKKRRKEQKTNQEKAAESVGGAPPLCRRGRYHRSRNSKDWFASTLSDAWSLLFGREGPPDPSMLRRRLSRVCSRPGLPTTSTDAETRPPAKRRHYAVPPKACIGVAASAFLQRLTASVTL